jgi:hypothetical protein
LVTIRNQRCPLFNREGAKTQSLPAEALVNAAAGGDTQRKICVICASAAKS